MWHGEAHLNEAFMATATNAWRKLASAARDKGYNESSLKKAFKAIDLDDDGQLDPGEIRLAIKSLAPQLSEVDITLMLACADKDADGQITEKEFTDMMMHNIDSDTPYWEKYGKRDNHGSKVADRKHQIRY